MIEVQKLKEYIAALPKINAKVWDAQHNAKSVLTKLLQDAVTVLERDAQSESSQKLAAVAEKEARRASSYPTSELDYLEEYSNARQQQRKAFIAQYGLDHPCLKKGADLTSVAPELIQGDATPHARGGPRLAPAYSDETLEWWLMDHLPQRVTLLPRHIAAVGRFRNPTPYVPMGFACDGCNTNELMVSLSAVGSDGTWDNTRFMYDLEGLDVCLACAIHLLQGSTDALRALLKANWAGTGTGIDPVVALSPLSGIQGLKIPGDTLRRPFGLGSELRIISKKKTKRGVRWTVSVAPRGSVPYCWIQSEGQRKAVEALPVIGDEKLVSYIDKEVKKVTDSGVIEVLYSAANRDLSRSESNQSNDSMDGMVRTQSCMLGCCSICLDDLHLSSGKCFQTNCGHWFHYPCLVEAVKNLKGKDLLCPLCRAPTAFERKETMAEVLASNIFEVVVDVEAHVEAGGTNRDDLIIAVLTSPDGQLSHACDIGAAARLQSLGVGEAEGPEKPEAASTS
jgi:hypothetical protein